MVSPENGKGTLVEEAATLVRFCWSRKDLFDHAKDKIIIYCRTRDEVRGLQENLLLIVGRTLPWPRFLPNHYLSGLP